MKTIRQCVKERGDAWFTTCPQAFRSKTTSQERAAFNDSWMMKEPSARKLRLLRDIKG